MVCHRAQRHCDGVAGERCALSHPHIPTYTRSIVDITPQNREHANSITLYRRRESQSPEFLCCSLQAHSAKYIYIDGFHRRPSRLNDKVPDDRRDGLPAHRAAEARALQAAPGMVKGGGMQSETLGRATARTPYMEQPRFGPSGAGAPLHAGSAGSPEQAGKPPGRWAATWAASKRGHVGQDPWIQLGAGARLGVLRCAQRRQQQMCPVSPG